MGRVKDLTDEDLEMVLFARRAARAEALGDNGDTEAEEMEEEEQPEAAEPPSPLGGRTHGDDRDPGSGAGGVTA